MNDEVYITDEVTLLKSKLADVTKQLGNIRQERDLAFVRISELEEREKRSERLIETITDENVRARQYIQTMRRQYTERLNGIKDRDHSRETVTGIIGAVCGCLTTAMIVVVYYITRYGGF